MAASRKSTKRSATKKRPAAKRQSGRTNKARATKKKKTKRKSASRTAGLKRRARKGLKAAKGGLSSVMQAGGKTWQTLKSTTTQVVEGIKEKRRSR